MFHIPNVELKHRYYNRGGSALKLLRDGEFFEIKDKYNFYKEYIMNRMDKGVFNFWRAVVSAKWSAVQKYWPGQVNTQVTSIYQ
jgi:hypothetical protein